MKNLSPILFSVAIVIASIFLGRAYVDARKGEHAVFVTGLGSQDFDSDLVVWGGGFSTVNSISLKAGYTELGEQKKVVLNYLTANGIKQEEMVFESVTTGERKKSLYNEGKYVGEQFLGYQLTQKVKIESNDVDKVEKLSREISELLNKGVDFNSQAPRYYYTKLSNLKIKMIEKATDDARIRAKTIAENSGGDLGKLLNARMGIFQITGKNSSEDYSWGGTYNTSSRKKTATITVKLKFESK